MSDVEKDCIDNPIVIDVSGEELKKRREAVVQEKHEERKNAIIELVMRQTNYSKEIASEKLSQWDNNYLHVIKEYMDPDFQKEKIVNKSNTKNQMIYGEIRNFMDDVNKQQIQRKRQAEQHEQRRLAYLTYLQRKNGETGT
uniref:Uncharacterized protein n=1 Tax=viral metagenome TaxID=1070528 RepID=A0A6C0C6D7_9ZZZZ